MVGLTKPPHAGVLDALIAKLRNLGLDRPEELQPFLEVVKPRGKVSRGHDILRSDDTKHLIVLLAGVSCLYECLEDGWRQIVAFQYAGDLCDLHRFALSESERRLAVGALTECSIGVIAHKDLERLVVEHRSVALTLWRAMMFEASVFRQKLTMVRRPALERVAHLLCEQLARCEAVGINSATIPLTQVDLADAVGLSIVHINRTVQELRRLGMLSTKGRAIEVVNKAKLATLANFDGCYLNMPQVLSHWHISKDRDPMAGVQSPATRSPSQFARPCSARRGMNFDTGTRPL
jgi:CRP-like cAMP-binding protein